MRLKNRPLNSESFSEFFNKIPIPTFAWHIVGEELVLIDFNNATEKLSFEGISLGIKASELFKDDKKILTNLFRCLREKCNFSEELEFHMKTTDELKILFTTYTFLLPDLVIFHVEDMTMQKQVRKALQEARDVLTGLELIINQSPAVVILIRNEEGWPVEYITDNIRQFGYEPSDFYSHILQFADLIHPDDLKDAITESYLKCQNGTNEFVQEYRIISKLGAHRWINIRTWVKRDRDNNITHFQGIILDITERRQTEEKLKESEEKFRKITEQSLLGVAIFQEGKIKYVNKALANLAEYSPIDIKEWPLNEFVKLVHPEDLPTVMQRMQEKLEDIKDVVSRYIFRILTKSGKIKWLEIISKVIIYQGSLAILATMIDITEKKQAEIKLQESEENLKKLNEVLEQKVSERTRDLKKSEEKYRFLYNETPIGIGTATKDGKVIAMNKTMEEIVGYGIKELNEMGISSLYVNSNRREQLLSILQKESRVQDFEVRLKRKDGTEFLALMDIAIIDLKGEKIIHSTVRDITERKLTDIKLKESEEKYRGFVNNISDIIYELDISGKCLYVSHQLFGISGFAPEEMIGQKVFKFVHPDDLMKVAEEVKRAFKSDVIQYIEFKLRHKDGHYIPISSRFNVITIGEKQKLTGVLVDMTERKKADQKLQESEEKYRQLFNTSPFAILLFDIKGKILDCNDTTSMITGYLKEELIGKNFKNFNFYVDPTQSKLDERRSTVSSGNIPEARELLLYRKDGSQFWARSQIEFVNFGEDTYIQAIIRDITEKKKAEDKLKESEIKYKEAYNKAEFYKDIFTHDINNILSNIKSAIELSAMYLKDPNRIPDVEKLYEVIRGQFKKGSSLVLNIRKLSQIEGSVSLVKSIDINDVLKKEIDFTLKSYQTRDVKIRTHGFERGILVNANDLLIDLFNNLFNNSIKYNDSRVVEIDVKMSREKKNNTNYIKLEFLDNGIGIPDKRKETLFEKEYVKDISSKGLGIGLTLVKKIVESYRGEIWVEDRIKGDYRQGTNFIVLIPEAL